MVWFVFAWQSYCITHDGKYCTDYKQLWPSMTWFSSADSDVMPASSHLFDGPKRTPLLGVHHVFAQYVKYKNLRVSDYALIDASPVQT